jgi:deoxyribose-phosphate aldolase
LLIVKYTYLDLAKMIDHSLLHPTLTDQELDAGCALAIEYQVASVCVKPYYVSHAAKLLRGGGVATGTVIGFPHGSNLTEIKRAEAEAACRDGATELDLVINIGKALSGDWQYIEEDIRAVCADAHSWEALVKVILENDFLPNDEIKKRLCQIAESSGADFVKTSTGFGYVKQSNGDFNYKGATDADLKLMRATCSPKIQIKAAGGVRDLASLIRVRELGATRCGTSATKAILDDFRRSTGESKKDSEAATSTTPGY